ncbi:KIF-binding protein-like [Ixodes scapularis]|uniref:KIF-binding protein-like n=1 Tax=Ixodes scapularis TaxID=6945 RepID=UPI001A9D2B58|nr:KIF-binding protein-like [Ixodes scapularis]
MTATAASAVWESKLKEIRNKYERARKLIDIESMPAWSTPRTAAYQLYRSTQALKILKELLEVIGQIETDSPSKEHVRALIKHDIGFVATETSEASLGLECCEECLRIIGEDRYEDPSFCSLAISALNRLGFIALGQSTDYDGRGSDPTRACEHLKLAENIYAKVSAGDLTGVRGFSDYFLPEGQACSETGVKDLERAHVYTLYYMVQAYELLGEKEKAAMYSYRTLKKQLATGDVDSVDWADAVARLSQFFIIGGNFGAGRHLLVCASYVLGQYATELDRDQSSPDHKEVKEEMLKCMSANAALCWAKYSLLLLVASREEATGQKDQEQSPSNQPYLLIELPEITALEAAVTDKLVANFDGAKPVFLMGLQWLTEAKDYYTVKSHTKEYIEIIQAMSKLYKELAFFEPAADRRCKMHKRRIDMLEEVLKEVNPKLYLNQCHLVMCELGQTYNEMMDIKFSSLSAAVKPNSHAVKKINSLIDKAIHHYTSFLDTLRDTSNEYPDKFADVLARPALRALFCVGTLHSRKVFQDLGEQIANLEMTKDSYEFVVNYCKKAPEHVPLVKEELEVMTKLLQLIPGMLQSLMSSAVY